MSHFPATSPSRRHWAWLATALPLAVLALAAAVVWLNLRGEQPGPQGSPPAPAPSRDLVARGAYLARAGNCMGCHSAPGQPAWSGGLGLDTPFGTVYSSNLTPDPDTGIGRWSASDFWRALHNGRSRDGRLLYPAFPYTSYTQVSRADSDALHAYLMQLPAVAQVNRPHALRWPYSSQAALAVWRALFFSPGEFQPDPAKPADWNRGAYLVRGLGHCSACHAPRNALGASRDELGLAGGLIPVQNWYAPSLALDHEAGVATWPRQRVLELLQTGVTTGATASGPMAEVVVRSTQHLSMDDLQAMTTYLQDLPERQPPPAAAQVTAAPPSASALRGARIYEQHCAACHGEQGQGVANAYPALAQNRAVTLDSPANMVQLVLHGGFSPATTGHPRPFGMPPYAQVLSEREIADVLTHLRTAWGHHARPVREVDVLRVRGAQ